MEETKKTDEKKCNCAIWQYGRCINCGKVAEIKSDKSGTPLP